jgi:hypothetical protein
MDEQTSPRNELEIRSTIESRPGAAITVLRIEMPPAIKAAISARIAAEKQGTKVTR